MDASKAGTIVPVSKLSLIPQAILDANPPVDRYTYLHVEIAPYQQDGVRRVGYRFDAGIY